MTVQLEYQSGPMLDDGKAFNARVKLPWKNDMLFRCFPTQQRVFFIKVGGSRNDNVAIHFGLIGWIIAHYAYKSEKKKTAARIADYTGKNPAHLMQQDKNNHILQRNEMTEPAINPPSFWKSQKYGSWSFRGPKRKKRVFKFEDADNFRMAVERLSEVFGDELTIRAQWDESKKKIVKIK